MSNHPRRLSRQRREQLPEATPAAPVSIPAMPEFREPEPLSRVFYFAVDEGPHLRRYEVGFAKRAGRKWLRALWRWALPILTALGVLLWNFGPHLPRL
ncbi:MAG TPA: hypothetical protein VFB13_12495 [Reyranella sp.]|jgi:hypothetical protein|nr:hypothetical protein [Reyranella sp.]